MPTSDRDEEGERDREHLTRAERCVSVLIGTLILPAAVCIANVGLRDSVCARRNFPSLRPPPSLSSVPDLILFCRNGAQANPDKFALYCRNMLAELT